MVQTRPPQAFTPGGRGYTLPCRAAGPGQRSWSAPGRDRRPCTNFSRLAPVVGHDAGRRCRPHRRAARLLLCAAPQVPPRRQRPSRPRRRRPPRSRPVLRTGRWLRLRASRPGRSGAGRRTVGEGAGGLPRRRHPGPPGDTGSLQGEPFAQPEQQGKGALLVSPSTARKQRSCSRTGLRRPPVAASLPRQSSIASPTAPVPSRSTRVRCLSSFRWTTSLMSTASMRFMEWVATRTLTWGSVLCSRIRAMTFRWCP